MKQITGAEINYLFLRGRGKLAPSWRGSLLDLLQEKSIPHDIRVAVALHSIRNEPDLLRSFALFCAKQVKDFFEPGDFEISALASLPANALPATLRLIEWHAKACSSHQLEVPDASTHFARASFRYACCPDAARAAALAASYARRACQASVSSGHALTASGLSAFDAAASRQAAALYALILKNQALFGNNQNGPKAA